MIKSLALIGTLSTLLTHPTQLWAANVSTQNEKIVCTETGTDVETHVTSVIGEITIQVDKTGTPQQIQFSRQGHADVPPIKKTFDIKTATVKTEIVSATLEKPQSPNEQSQTQIITASDNDRKSLILKINDQIHSGIAGSSYIYEYGKMHISSMEETTLVTCEGKLKIAPKASATSVALEKTEPKK